jgi:hypothetical protein
MLITQGLEQAVDHAEPSRGKQVVWLPTISPRSSEGEALAWDAGTKKLENTL